MVDSFFHDQFRLLYLNLAGNNISDIGLEKLAPAFNYNRTLRSLDLQNNQLSEASVSMIMPFVKFNSRLVKLNLDHNFCKLRLV